MTSLMAFVSVKRGIIALLKQHVEECFRCLIRIMESHCLDGFLWMWRQLRGKTVLLRRHGGECYMGRTAHVGACQDDERSLAAAQLDVIGHKGAPRAQVQPG